MFDFKSHGEFDPATMLFPIAAMFWSIVLIFIVCMLGEMVTDGFVEINDVICQLDWYLYPMEIQRIMPNVLCATQQLVIVKGLSSLGAYTREAFQKVCFDFFIPKNFDFLY